MKIGHLTLKVVRHSSLDEKGIRLDKHYEDRSSHAQSREAFTNRREVMISHECTRQERRKKHNPAKEEIAKSKEKSEM